MRTESYAARRARAIARRYERDADYLLAKTEYVRVETERLRHVAEWEQAGDAANGVFRLWSPIDLTTASQFVSTISAWSRLHPGAACEISITSPGGDLLAALVLYDFLRGLPHQVTTLALGLAASAAAVVLQAGHHRVMASEAWLLIHEGSTTVSGSYGTAQDTMGWLHRVQERVVDIFAARSTLDREAIRRNWERRDWWLSSREALELGLIDEVR